MWLQIYYFVPLAIKHQESVAQGEGIFDILDRGIHHPTSFDYRGSQGTLPSSNLPSSCPCGTEPEVFLPQLRDKRG